MSFKILAIDGGGIRGIFPAYILKKIKEEFNIKNITNEFDMIVGTSTGSIIAGCLACGIEPDIIYNLYKNYGNKIFKKKLFSRISFNLFTPKYSKKVLEELLDSIVCDIKLKNIKKRMIITATDVKHGKAILFRSGVRSGKRGDVLLKNAILASISAPYYFNFEEYNDSFLADGGLWANNPSIVGFIEAKYHLKVKEEDIKILSLGTGINKNKTFISHNRLKFSEIDDFINLLLSLQANHLDALSYIMLKKNFLKVTFEEENLSIDKLSPTFLEKTEIYYLAHKKQIEEFLKR